LVVAGASEKMHLVRAVQRFDANTLKYEVTRRRFHHLDQALDGGTAS